MTLYITSILGTDHQLVFFVQPTVCFQQTHNLLYNVWTSGIKIMIFPEWHWLSAKIGQSQLRILTVPLDHVFLD